MSEEPDKDSKTEEPTEKKVRDAIDRGNVASSKEVSTFATLAAALIAAVFLMRTGVSGTVDLLSTFISDPAGFDLSTSQTTSALLVHVVLHSGAFLAPIFVLFIVAGLAASFLQNPPQLALERIKPQASRLSIGKGWKRVFGAQGFVEFAKSVGKLVGIGVVIWILLKSDQYKVITAMLRDPSTIPELILSLSTRLLSAACVATILLVAFDLVWSRRNWRQQLRMTKQELKDEYKQTEGDPIVKAKRRSLARDRVRRRMMASVPQATLVIANPTHYAVALRYVREEGGAPIVLAKGQDLIALKIREIAESNNIPVIEDVALARSLYAAVEIDAMIPPEFYKVVAELICFVYARKIA